MFKLFLVLGLLSGCATTQKVVEPKFRVSDCIKFNKADSEESFKEGQIVSVVGNKYVVGIGILELEGGILVMVERASIEYVNKNYSKTACESPSQI